MEKDFFFDSISTHLQVKPHSLAFFLHSLSPKFPRMSLYFPLPLHNHLIYFSLYQQSSLFSFPLIFVRSSTCSYLSIQCTHPFCPPIQMNEQAGKEANKRTNKYKGNDITRCNSSTHNQEWGKQAKSNPKSISKSYKKA